MVDFIDDNKNCSRQEFQISGCVITKALIGDIGLTFTPTVHNVERGPVAWSLNGFGGDIQNVLIDENTGTVTYDAVTTLTNNGNSSFTVTAEDACGKKHTKEFCFKINDPVVVTPLACNGNLQENSEDIVGKLILFAKADTGAMYQDLAKTTLALNAGDPVSVLEDSTGGGDLVVVAPDGTPTLSLSSINGNNTLVFSQSSNTALEYAVPSAPPQGSPFKFFALVRLSGTVNNSSIISSVTPGNTSSTSTGTWQITDDDGFLAFRFAGGGSNVVLGSLVGSTDVRSAITRAQMNDGEAHLVYCKYDGTTVELFWDGVKVVEFDPTFPLYGQYLKPFENRGSNNFIDGELAEMLYADASMTDEEALITQSYLICKYKLDASLLGYASPFDLDLTVCYDTISQFEYHTLSDNSNTVYDVVNNVYYNADNVPAPGLGLLNTPSCGTNTSCDVEGVDTDICDIVGALQDQIDSINTNTVDVDRSLFIQSTVAPDDIHNNGSVVLFSGDVRVDANWSRTANVFTYTGNPNAVIGRISLNAVDNGASSYWSRPKLRVLKGGNIIAVIDDLVMQQNGAYDGDATINGSFVDATPGTNPSYTFEWFDKENRTATLAVQTFSNITLQAIEKVTVLIPQV